MHTLAQLEEAIRRSWGPDTVDPDDGWSDDNPARGQCDVTSLVAVAASHLDWTGKPSVLGPLGWLVTVNAIATGAALVVTPIRRLALGAIERAHYAAALTWLLVVALSIV